MAYWKWIATYAMIASKLATLYRLIILHLLLASSLSENTMTFDLSCATRELEQIDKIFEFAPLHERGLTCYSKRSELKNLPFWMGFL